MLNEFDVIALTRDLPEHGLRRGDTGTIVHCHEGVQAYIVEFFTDEGATIDVLTLAAADVRPASEREIRRARPGIAATAPTGA